MNNIDIGKETIRITKEKNIFSIQGKYIFMIWIMQRLLSFLPIREKK